MNNLELRVSASCGHNVEFCNVKIGYHSACHVSVYVHISATPMEDAESDMEVTAFSKQAEVQ